MTLTFSHQMEPQPGDCLDCGLPSHPRLVSEKSNGLYEERCGCFPDLPEHWREELAIGERLQARRPSYNPRVVQAAEMFREMYGPALRELEE